MLTAIHIKNFLTVEQLILDFHTGLTVLTGETGAGKSILIDALGLALGNRCDSNIVRTNTQHAEIQACFDTNKLPKLQQWLTDNLLATEEENECLVRRSINQQGRSKAFINGNIVTLSQLKKLGEQLVDIHAQNQHQKLTKLIEQQRYLDEFAKHPTLLKQVSSHYKQWQQLHDSFTKQQTALTDSQQRIEYLQYQVNELKSLDLQPQEIDSLETEQKRLSHLQQLQLDGTNCQQILTDSETNINYSLQQCISLLEKMQQFDSQCESITNLLKQSLIYAEEGSSELQNYLNKANLDPQQYNYIEQRLTTIYELARKHKVEPTALPELLAQMELELTELNNADTTIEQLKIQLDKEWQQYLTTAQQLSTNREQAAQQLSSQINILLQQLNLTGAKLQIKLHPKQQQNYDANGLESTEFLVCLNPGQPFSPLHKTASGGELSRISLAIEVATMHSNPVPTMIFDEVDVGIGGATAEIVGKLLRKLGQQTQVLCVTHLPQVSSQANYHLLVNKTQSSANTHTKITLLDKQQRINEVARMLAGVNITNQSIKNAEEMLENQ